MINTVEFASCCSYFEKQHEQHTHPAMRALESEVLGCDFGGTSWTTREQADRIPAALGLEPGSHLLEIGAGTGWPGVYLSGRSGCDVTLLDLPVNSLGYASRRASDENIAKRVSAVAASAAALPFRNAVFTAISHSDVLCCLPEKTAVLEECRRVARAGCQMLFYVIAPAPDLSAGGLEEACRVGPPFVGVTGDYASMLAAAGWRTLRKTDLTGDYLDALRTLLDLMQRQSAELEPVFGKAEFGAQLQRRISQIAAIDRGLLKREAYLAKAD